MGKKYLIYVDILGFEKLAKKIAKDKGIEAKIVRNHFIDVIKEKVEDIETKYSIAGRHYGESDDWILVADSLDNTIGIVSDILDHSTGYEGYKEIPLEIEIGVAEYDRWARFNGKYLITEDETISFLKTYLLKYYRTWYKKRKKKKIKSTFIVLTEEAHRRLEPLDKKMCKKIHCKKRKMMKKKKLKSLLFSLLM